jgi:hypothetical protein
VASEPFVNQMRRGNVQVNASRKTFKNIYASFHTFHRMGASQERAAFFNATLLVVTRHPGGPPGRPKIHPVLPRFALFFISFVSCAHVIIACARRSKAVVSTNRVVGPCRVGEERTSVDTARSAVGPPA